MARYRGRHRRPCVSDRIADGLSVGIRRAVIVGFVTAAPAALAPSAFAGTGWDPIIHCESGGNPNVVNSTGHAGLLQFSASTWRRFGGAQFAPTADRATPDQQIAVARRAFDANGLSDWEASRHCWAGKVNTAELGTSASTPLVASTASGRHATDTSAPRHALSGVPQQAVTVVSGDTLAGIAITHGESWQALYSRNRGVVGANPDSIFPGQIIRL